MQKEYIKVPIGSLVPYENNPRINDEAVPYVEESINQVGYITPIVIDENNIILAGHTRLKALENNRHGAETIEVLRVSGLSEEQKRKYRLLDNKTSEKAKWDFTKLEEELSELDFGDFDFEFESDTENEEQQEKQEQTQSIDYKESISVVIECKNDEEAEEIFNALTQEGYSCRISTL